MYIPEWVICSWADILAISIPSTQMGETEVRAPYHTGKTSLWSQGRQDSGGLHMEILPQGPLGKSLMVNLDPKGQCPQHTTGRKKCDDS